MNSRNNFTGPVNIGNPVEYSIGELATRIVDLCGSSSTIKYFPLPSDDPKQRKPDISLAKQELDWSPTVQLDDGLKRTIKYFNALLAATS
jgi:UDP-glucuronate decarboxylase